jgi:hypothetical protein
MYIPEFQDVDDVDFIYSYSKIPIIKGYHASITHKEVSDVEHYFACFSLCVLFPLLYGMLISADRSVVMILYRFIRSGLFDTVSYIKEFMTNLYYIALRMFGQYSYSTYTVVRSGREIYSASSIFFYHKSDVNSVYRIDRAKYNVCKWIDKQCQLYRDNHHEEPEINETHNAIYDFILHKVDDQPYTRIHRGDFTGRTHTLITEHYRVYPKSRQIAETAELTVYTRSSTVEPPMRSSYVAAEPETETETETDPCFMPQKFTINLKWPQNFLLEKNEILDSKFLQWKLYNEFGKSDLANRLCSLFYNYKVTINYHDCMKDHFNEFESLAASKLNIEENMEDRMRLYCLNEQQSVIIGKLYVVKVDSILRCPVIESGENQVFDIDNLLTSFYDCSDSERDSDSESQPEYDTDDECDTDSEHEAEAEVSAEASAESSNKNENMASDDPEFEIVSQSSE